MKNDGIELEIKQKIVGLLLVLFPDAKIYLYGSRALGTHRERSDIDLALDLGQEEDPVKLGEARSVLGATHIPYRIDLVDLNAVSPALRETILKEGFIWNVPIVTAAQPYIRAQM